MSEPIRVGVAGLGTIGKELVRWLSEGIAGHQLCAVGARDETSAARYLSSRGVDVCVTSLDALEAYADVVVECAVPEAVATVATPVLTAGKEVVVLSAVGLLEHPYLVQMARDNVGRITIPSGGLGGFDAIAAAREATITSAEVTSRKAPRAFVGSSYMQEVGIDPLALTEATTVFRGSVRDAARHFPTSANVGVALALASLGPDRTTLSMVVDPSLFRTVHTVRVESPACSLELTVENVPSDNPRTARMAALSVVSLLRKRVGSLVVGS
jgi:aspartate dehydrogenase